MVLHAAVGFGLVCASLCVGLLKEDFLSDSQWLQAAQQVSVGHPLDFSERASIEIDAPRRFKALGFVPCAPHIFCKQADLTSSATLSLQKDPSLSQVDTIAVMSIDRFRVGRPYLYDTLHSLLDELPAQAEINVVVGDERDGYVVAPKLQELFGAEKARRIHVISTSKSTAHYLAENFDVQARASWNLARILRGYRGRKHLLVMQDDVLWSRGSLHALQKVLRSDHPSLMSLYNYFCAKLPGANPDRLFDARVLSFPARAIDRDMEKLQALVLTPELAQSLGEYLSVRVGNDTVDNMMGQFLRMRDVSVGYIQPSMVQHMGFLTSGLGPFHESVCFSPIFPAL